MALLSWLQGGHEPQGVGFLPLLRVPSQGQEGQGPEGQNKRKWRVTNLAGRESRGLAQTLLQGPGQLP